MESPEEEEGKAIWDSTVLIKPTGRKYILKRGRDGEVRVALLGPIPKILGRASGPAEAIGIADVDDRLREWKKKRGPIPKERRNP